MLHLICLATLLPLHAATAPAPPCAFVPAGELAARIALVHKRFAEVTEPAFTDKFILADVELDPAYPRRFSEFSGDISGRYIGAMAMLPPSDPKAAADLDRIVEMTLSYQRADGRFGNDKLVFTAAEVGPEQMALLWGNGRLLVGLLEYNSAKPSDKVLEASRRLGDFLLKVFDACAKPEVIERLRGKAANGFICFTQFNEGLELLARATGDARYRDAAAKMLSLMEAPGDQHTHGYLTTLRGHMMIYESTHDKAQLDAVVVRYLEMISSGAVKTNGGVLEYFKKDYTRDEGCSEADFVRLSLQLWRATGHLDFLNRAEKCLYNSFFPNQFATGDFGHHDFDGRGYITVPGPGRAWWCCTMHGLRALRDVLDSVVTQEGKNITLNLYLEGQWLGKDMTLRVERHIQSDAASEASFRVLVEKAPASNGVTDTSSVYRFNARQAEWTDRLRLSWQRDGKTIASMEITPPSSKPGEKASPRDDKHSGGLGTAPPDWMNGDMIDIQFPYLLRLMDGDGKFYFPGNFVTDKPKPAVVFYGPWMMGIDAAFNPMFHGEPLDNMLLLPDEKTLASQITFGDSNTPLLSGPRIELAYIHSGFSDLGKVVLGPLSEQTTHEQTTVSYWHPVKKAN
jgi:hypothetical protein